MQLDPLDRPRGLALAASLLAAVLFFELSVAVNTVAAHAPLLFFALPVTLCAVAFGLRGGLVAAGVSVVLTVYGSDLSPLGDVPPAAMLVALGGVIGAFADDRRRREGREKQHALELAAALDDSRTTNRQLNLVAGAVLDGLVTIDRSGTILTFNAASERIFGYRYDEVTGRNVSVLMPDADRRQHDGHIATYVGTGRAKIIGTGHREVVGKRQDGSVFPMELAVGKVGDGDRMMFIGVVRDITKRKQREAAELNYKSILEESVRARTVELQARTAELDDARLETLRRLALAAEYRDDQTFEHTERVGRIAALLGERLGFTEREVARLRQAAPLHDIGKLAVSDTILLNPGKLSAAERLQMQVHTIAGEAILSGSTSDVLGIAAEIALTHHEWWDGTGYPAGLEGEKIPLRGRIVCLADVWDALTHARPYKEAWSVERAMAEILRLRGRQFDPDVVDAFEQLGPREIAPHIPDDSQAVTPARSRQERVAANSRA